MDLLKYMQNGTLLQPVLSIPGSSYKNFNKFRSPFFKRLPVVHKKTGSKDGRAALVATKLDEDELVASLDVMSLYTNIPFEEAIEVALKDLYSSDEVCEKPRSAMKSLSRLALTNVHFNLIKCGTVNWTV